MTDLETTCQCCGKREGRVSYAWSPKTSVLICRRCLPRLKLDDAWRGVQLQIVRDGDLDPRAALDVLEDFVREHTLPRDIRWELLGWQSYFLLEVGDHAQAFEIHERLLRWASPLLPARICQHTVYARDLLKVGRVERAHSVLKQGLALAATDSGPAVDGELRLLLETLCLTRPKGHPGRPHLDSLRRLAAFWRFPLPTRTPRSWRDLGELVDQISAHARAHDMMPPDGQADARP